MAHLMRRAGFGATRSELEALAAKGYDATVEELLHPENQPPLDIYEYLRYYHGSWKPGTMSSVGHSSWVWRMINTNAPLQEKMCLFWHHVFATGVAKVDHYDEITDMIDMFREKGLGKYRDILVEVARNPAMIYWLDNNENHAHSVNENWGRELLELFTLGVDNYTETDVREASRAFTGWTITPKLPRFHMGRWDWYFEYNPEDHDDGEKTFLSHTGNFNGEDIIDIVLLQPATARFVARHLYNFFVADEVQVPAWSVTPPQDPDAIEVLAQSLLDTDYDIRATLRVLFHSDFFKEARFRRVKSPTEVVVSTLRLAGDTGLPSPGTAEFSNHITFMGQHLLNPPSVEGWHTGTEWIASGSLTKRVNFMAELVSDGSRSGIRELVERAREHASTPESLLDACLDLIGPVEVKPETYAELADHAMTNWGRGSEAADADGLTRQLFQLIVATREYQMA
jgi:uncharacterized protein (DUF1800 family)